MKLRSVYGAIKKRARVPNDLRVSVVANTFSKDDGTANVPLLVRSPPCAVNKILKVHKIQDKNA